MQGTRYFDFRRTMPDRAQIRDAWIEAIVQQPIKKEYQKDGRIKIWGKVPEAGGKYLRIILLEDGKTVHNAFFDRNFKE
jgi:hypothetical protein